MHERIWINGDEQSGGIFAEHTWAEGGGKKFVLAIAVFDLSKNAMATEGVTEITEPTFNALKREVKLQKKKAKA